MWNIAATEEGQDDHRMALMRDASQKVRDATYFSEVWNYENKKEEEKKNDKLKKSKEFYETSKKALIKKNEDLKKEAEIKEQELGEVELKLDKIHKVSKSESLNEFLKHYNDLG